ncbi:hypothetical protein [Geoglobus ahangari]
MNKDLSHRERELLQGRGARLAEEHARWFAKWISKLIQDVYYDAFIHGYKHALQDRKLLEDDEGER